MDPQELLIAAVFNYHVKEYEEVINISQQAALALPPQSEELFQINVLLVISSVRKNENDHHVILLLLQMLEEKGLAVIQVILQHEGPEFIETFQEYAVANFIEKNEDLVHDVFVLLFGIFSQHPYWISDITLYFWIRLIEKHREPMHLHSNLMDQVFMSALQILSAEYIKSAAEKWFSVGTNKFKAFMLVPSSKAFAIVENLSKYIYCQGTSVSELFHVAKLHRIILNSKIVHTPIHDLKLVPQQYQSQCFKIWSKFGETNIEQKRFNEGRFFLECALMLRNHTDLSDFCKYRILTAFCHFKSGNIQKAKTNLLVAVSKKILRKDNVQALRIKEMAKELYSSKDYRMALEFYLCSVKMVLVDEKYLRAEINANISLIYSKLERYSDATSFAEKCIELNPKWDKGYYRLAFSLFKSKKFERSIENIKKGMEFSNKQKKEHIDFFMLWLKNRHFSEAKQDELSMSCKEDFKLVLNKLNKESTNESWSAISNLVLTTTVGRSLDVKSLSLYNCLLYNGSNEIFEYLVKHGCNVNERITNTNILQLCLQKKMYKWCALLIVNGAYFLDEQTTKPVVARCVEMIIKEKCELEVLECMMSLLNIESISAPDDQGNTPLHICCSGQCTKTKLEILKILLKYGIKTNISNLKKQTPAKMLQPLDPRLFELSKVNQNCRTEITEEKPRLAKSSRDEKPKDSTTKSLKSLNAEQITSSNPNSVAYIPDLTMMELHQYHQKKWKDAVKVFKKKINLKKSYGDEKRRCELFVFAAVSCLEIYEEKTAFLYIKNATQVHAKNGVEMTKDVLKYCYGDSYIKRILSHIINKCIASNYTTAEQGIGVLSLLEKDNRYVDITKVSLNTHSSDLSIEDLSQNLKDGKIVKREFLNELSTAWFECGKKSFENEKFDVLAFRLVVALREGEKHDQLIGLSYLYIAVYQLSNSNYEMPGKNVLIYPEGPLELLKEWEAIIEVEKNERKMQFFIENSIYLLSQFHAQTKITKDRFKILLKRFVEVNFEKKRKKLKENLLRLSIDLTKKLEVEDEELSEDFFRLKEEAEKQKPNKVLLPLLEILLHVLPTKQPNKKADILFELAERLTSENRHLEACDYMKECLKLVEPDPKCYLLYGQILMKLKKYEESLKVFYDGLIVKDATNEVKSELMANLFLVRGEKCETSPLKLPDEFPDDVIRKTFNDLKKQNDEAGWKAIENMIIYTSSSQNLLQDVTLERLLKFTLSEEIVTRFVKYRRCSDVTHTNFKNLLNKEYIEAASHYLLKKGKDPTILESPLYLAVYWCLKTGKLKLLDAVLCALNDEEIRGDIRKCVNECGKGLCSSRKEDILKTLLERIKNIKEISLSRNMLGNLKENDKRMKLLQNFIKCVNKNSDEKFTENIVKFRDIDKELMDAVNALPNYEDVEETRKREVQEERLLLLSKLKAGQCEKGLNEIDVEDVKIPKVPEAPCADLDKTVEGKEEDGEEDDEEEIDITQITELDDTWEIECTQDVYRVLRSKKVHQTMKKKIIKKIKFLARGEWPREVMKPLEGVPGGIKLYETKINKGSRILLEISVSFSARRSVKQDIYQHLDQSESGEKGAIYEDKIRLWNIALHHDDVPGMIEKIVHSHKRGHDCIIKKELKGIEQTPQDDKLRKYPNVYVNEDLKEYRLIQQGRSKSSMSQKLNKKQYMFIPPASPNKQEYNILKFYSFTCQAATRLLSADQSSYDFPFEVSPLEFAIIQLEPKHQCAILLLGRSGTGKTTCCLYRLWSQYQTYWKKASLPDPHIPKFKMKPPEEKEDNEPDDCHMTNDPSSQPSINNDEQTSKLNEGSSQIFDEEEYMTEDCEHLRQVMVTKNDVLCSEIKKNFVELCQGSQITYEKFTDDFESKTFRDIQPEAYPLFITSKDLLLLLDNSLPGTKFFERNEDGARIHKIPGWGRNKENMLFLPLDEDSDDEDEDIGDERFKADQQKERLKTSRKKREVTYDVFINEFWPELLKKKKVNCHPSLVWMEIKSFIKGSAESFYSRDDENNIMGYLSKEEYKTLGKKRAPNFEGNREEIYDMFLWYQKLKSMSTYFDEMDVCFNIFKRLNEAAIPNWLFHQVYVDETQDFTQSELLVLMRCSANPNAMFFTGDTAQSIMRGVSFRFCDLQSLFLVAQREFESRKMSSPIVVPKRIHQLTHNYRSHTGILKLSSTIVKLLKLIFPKSIDSAIPDVGLFPGPLPKILNTDDFTELAILLKGCKRQTSAIEFGAHQVVLVQDENSKKSLPAELSYGLVLTVYEAKGLEFDDVLLYNFFKDSPASDEWRVVDGYIDKVSVESDTSASSLRVMTTDDLDSYCRPLKFEYGKHKLLNSELKKLYTAVTRARVNVWIFDEDKTKRAPMFHFLQVTKLVDVVKLEDGTTQESFVEHSSKDDWNKQALFFYKKNLYKLAAKCAERSENDTLREECEAKLQFTEVFALAKELRQKKIRKSFHKVHRRFKETALSFLKCGLLKEAKVCLRNAKVPGALAVICEKKGEFLEAANNYKNARKHLDAIRCYKKCNHHSAVINILEVEKRYTEVLEYLNRFMNPTEMQIRHFVNKAFDYYHEQKDQVNLKVVLGCLDFRQQEEFLRNKGDILLLEDIYKANNKDGKLANFYAHQNNLIEAVKVAPTSEQKAGFLIRALKESYDCNKGGKEHSEFSHLIEECLDKLDEDAHKQRAELHFFKTRLTGSIQHLTNIETFDIAKDHIGKLLYLTLLELGGESTIYKYFDLIVDCVEKTLSVLSEMLKGSTSPPVINTLNRIGYDFDGKNSFKEADFASLKFFKRVTGIGLDKNPRKTCEMIVLHLIGKLIGNVNTFAKILLTSNTVCQLHQSSFENNCHGLHGKPTEVDLSNGCTGVNILLNLISLCQEVKKILRKTTAVDVQDFSYWLEDYETSELTIIYNFFQSFLPFIHIMKSANYKTTVNQCLKNFHKKLPTVTSYLIEKNWEMSVKEKTMGIDAYTKLSFLSYQFNIREPLIDALRESKREKYYPYNSLWGFNEGLSFFYEESNVKKGLLEYIKLLKSLPPESPNTFCDIMEVPLTFLLTSLAATALNEEFPLFFPTSYIENVLFWDSLYSTHDGTRSRTFNYAISKLNRKKKNWEYFYNHLKDLCVILSDENLVFIKELVKCLKEIKIQSIDPSSPCCNSAARIICLYLVVLANLELNLKSLGNPIITLFNAQTVEGDHRLIFYFNKIKNIKNAEHARRLLAQFCQEKFDSLEKYEWSTEHCRLLVPNIISASKGKKVQQIKILQRKEGVMKDEKVWEKEPLDVPKCTETSLQDSAEIIEKKLLPEGYYDDENLMDEEDQTFVNQRKKKRKEQQRESGRKQLSKRYYLKWREYVHKRSFERQKKEEELKQVKALRIMVKFLKENKEKYSKVKKMFTENRIYIEKTETCSKCKLCLLPTNTNFDVYKHLNSKLHESNVENFQKSKEIESLYDVCKKQYNGKMDPHIESLMMRRDRLFYQLSKEMRYPYSKELEINVHQIKDELKLLDGREDEFDEEFENIEDSKRKKSQMKKGRGKNR